MFADWLLEKFGKVKCVDVAGGSGDLTRELLDHGFQSVVIDPRRDTKRCGDGIEQVFELFDVLNPKVREAC